MCILRRQFVRRKRLLASVVLLVGLTRLAFWRAHEANKGTLVLDCPDDSFAVEIFTDSPASLWETIFGSDPRPQWLSWGQSSAEIGTRRCVYFREIDRSRHDIRLPPGRYVLAAHRKSPCGHFGGDTVKTFDVDTSSEVAISIPN